MVKIAFYGKGGIGKSTTVTNIAVALAQKGYRVLQVGCDPKADSTRLLHAQSSPERTGNGGCADLSRLEQTPEDSAGIPGGTDTDEVSALLRLLRTGGSRTVMNMIRERKPFTAEDIVRTGFAGVLCAEAGGPLPGQGCAGRAVITALEKMEEIGVYDTYRLDVVLYDVLGDVVCGGFAMPMRKGFADYVYILTSGETMSMYAAANIALALEHFRGRGYAKLGGIILNRRDVPDEEKRVARLAGELGTEITGILAHSGIVPQAEGLGQCVLEAFPDTEIAQEYRTVAERILSGV